MNRRERLERMLELRRSKVEACRAAAGHLQGQVDDAVSALDAAEEQLRRTEELQRQASSPGGIDLKRVLALEEGVLGVRGLVVRSASAVAATERRRDEVRARLEIVAREARGSERALARCEDELARAERRRTWNALIDFSLRGAGREEAA